MIEKILVAISGALTVAAISTTAMAQTAPAASSTPQAVACFESPAKMADEEIASFLGNPSGMISQFETGGLPLSTRVRSLAGSSADTLAPIIALLENANPLQVSAIGAGLARAARACSASQPEYAALIQENVAVSSNEALLLAFANTLNEVQTAALGGGAAGGAGAGAGGGASGIGGAGAGTGAGSGSGDVTGETGIATSDTGAASTRGSGRFFSNNIDTTTGSPG